MKKIKPWVLGAVGLAVMMVTPFIVSACSHDDFSIVVSPSSNSGTNVPSNSNNVAPNQQQINPQQQNIQIPTPSVEPAPLIKIPVPNQERRPNKYQKENYVPADSNVPNRPHAIVAIGIAKHGRRLYNGWV